MASIESRLSATMERFDLLEELAKTVAKGIGSDPQEVVRQSLQVSRIDAMVHLERSVLVVGAAIVEALRGR